jgi:uncharacterized protein YecE (DUF72 family)
LSRKNEQLKWRRVKVIEMKSRGLSQVEIAHELQVQEMDSTFYNRFYSKMTKGTFVGMVKATPEKFQFSIKVPETITHNKRLNVDKGAITDLEEFLDLVNTKTNKKLLDIELFH